MGTLEVISDAPAAVWWKLRAALLFMSLPWLCPALFSIVFVTIPLSAARSPFDLSQLPWASMYLILICIPFLLYPQAMLNLFHTAPGHHRHSLRPMIKSVAAFFILSLVIPYIFGMYPLYPCYMIVTALPVASSLNRASLKKVAVIQDAGLSAKQVLVRRVAVASMSSMYLFAVCFAMYLYVVVAASVKPIGQVVAGLALSMAAVFLRIGLPSLMFERLELAKIRQLTLDRNIRAYLTLYLDTISEAYLMLVFKKVYRPLAIIAIVTAQVSSIVLSSLWLFPRFSRWMAQGPDPQSPFSQVGLAVKIVRRVSRRNSSRIVPHVVEQIPTADTIPAHQFRREWRDPVRTILFMRWFTQMIAMAIFVTIMTLATFTKNGIFLAIRPKDSDAYYHAIFIAVISSGCQSTALVLMSVASFWCDSADEPTFFRVGYNLLTSDRKALIWTIGVSLNVLTMSVFNKPTACTA